MIPELTSALARLQEYASSYFEIIYKTIFPYWQLPEVPSGGNILTGIFATALIYLARNQMSLSSEPYLMAQLLLATLFVILLISGIAIVFDPTQNVNARLANMKRLVSVVCVGITLGCAFIFFDSIVPWIDFVQSWAASKTLSAAVADSFIATISALLASVVIYSNTIFQIGANTTLRSLRINAWAVMTFIIMALGINLLIAPPW